MVWLFVDRELRDVRANPQVWSVYLVLGVVAAGIPILVAALLPALTHGVLTGTDPALRALVGMLRVVPEFAGLDPAEALARYLLRSTAGMLLLMPVALSATGAAFSIVGEKQQHTLEPILATPITDREFLVGKLCAVLVPTVGVTWVAGMVGAAGTDALLWSRYGGPMLPDRYWIIGAGVLAPLLAAVVILITMRLSARATDPQATVQSTALTVIPGFLFLLALLGKVLTVFFPALLGACVAAGAGVLWLLRGNVRRFEREEILTRWK